MLKMDAYPRLRDGTSKVNRPDFRYKPATGRRDSTKTIGGVTFGQMYDNKRREGLVEEVAEYTAGKLMDPSMESKVSVVNR